jgi:hypothetical protein
MSFSLIHEAHLGFKDPLNYIPVNSDQQFYTYHPNSSVNSSNFRNVFNNTGELDSHTQLMSLEQQSLPFMTTPGLDDDGSFVSK